MKFALAVVLLVSSVSAVHEWVSEPIASGSESFLPRAEFGTYTNGGVGYFFGGRRQTDFNIATGTYFNEIWKLQSAGGTLSLTKINPTGTNNPTPRSRSGFAVSNDYMLVVGGQRNDNGLPQAIGDHWLFDRTNDRWIPVTGGPSARIAASVVTEVGGSSTMFYVFGGISGLAAVLDDYWQFDASSLEWTQLTNANGRYDAKGAQLGRVSYFYGGGTIAPVGNPADTGAVSDFATFTTTSSGGVTSGLLSPADAPDLSQAGFTTIRNGAMFMLTAGSLNTGGTTDCGAPSQRVPLNGNNITYTYDVAAGSWAEFPTMEGPAVIDAGLVELGDESVYLLGGYFYNCTNNSGTFEGSGRENVDGGLFSLSLATPSPTGSPTISLAPTQSSSATTRDLFSYHAILSVALMAILF